MKTVVGIQRSSHMHALCQDGVHLARLLDAQRVIGSVVALPILKGSENVVDGDRIHSDGLGTRHATLAFAREQRLCLDDRLTVLSIVSTYCHSVAHHLSLLMWQEIFCGRMND